MRKESKNWNPSIPVLPEMGLNLFFQQFADGFSDKLSGVDGIAHRVAWKQKHIAVAIDCAGIRSGGIQTRDDLIVLIQHFQV